MDNKFLLILGVSGVGKTTIINNLLATDTRFEYIRPFTNRPLRKNETEKIYKTDSELEEMITTGDVLFINKIYGYTYATPKRMIYDLLAGNKFPVLDFPIQRLSEIKAIFPEKTFSAYLLPPSIEELSHRLNDGRDKNGNRLEYAINEIDKVNKQIINGYDLLLTNYSGKSYATTQVIYDNFIMSIQLKA